MRFFDLHCDTAYECACHLDGISLDKGAEHLSLGKGEKIRQWHQVFAIFMPDEAEGKACRGEMARRHYEQVLGYLYRQERRLSGSFRICRTAEEYSQSIDDGVCSGIISVEGGSAACGSLERIRRMYSEGVRLMTLTWNADNELGSGVLGSGGGLTRFGRQAVELMNELDMIVDVSHLSDNGFYDVAEIATKPFVASHSCARSLCANPRNLTDDMYRIVCKKGGLVGLNFYREFLCDGGNASIDDILRHAEHFLSLGGEDVLCMGSDFDGAEMPYDVTGIESVPTIYERFLKANYSEELVNKIFFDNAHNFFGKALCHSF